MKGASRQSAANVVTLLYEIIDKPGSYLEDPKWTLMLATQRSLAEFTCSELEIYGCSLNTFKKLMSTTVGVGFHGVNALRARARSAIEGTKKKESSRKISSRRNYVAQINELKLQIQEQNTCYQQLVVVISKLKVLAKDLALNESIVSRRHYWEKESKDIDMLVLYGRSKDDEKMGKAP
ncbi:hypothetical protein [Pseudomonas sp. GM80]|uniref:hypothetical protein n=1 Tax=Pseudomonas sp. GM80 TaxID=1144339 RepID=UPI00026F4E4B|nr:hypothetical protein [Pseudomonas sp. GM80]EJN34417.1 hypothetical protein PMI37_01277 [Pseudomonas sp. GM80]